VFDHIAIRVGDLAAAKRFYDLALDTIDFRGERFVSDAGVEWDDFAISPAAAPHPATRRLHVGFAAPSRAHVDAFCTALTGAGYTDDGAPGPRPQYRDDYYGAFVLDPDGNSAEAVHHEAVSRAGGTIDHVWLRTPDVPAARRFYETIAPVVGIELRRDDPDRVAFGFRDGRGSFTFVAGGEPTEHVHLAFGVADDATVDDFHRVALAAGYHDNGAPGERPEYHAGYYGAYVVDPDGHNVETVCHNRN
jgi:catechol 2,3-dioxygenase-like lactoylglutathione lyase family enzyme